MFVIKLNFVLDKIVNGFKQQKEQAKINSYKKPLKLKYIYSGNEFNEFELGR